MCPHRATSLQPAASRGPMIDKIFAATAAKDMETSN
jgi:hypothetical protein